MTEMEIRRLLRTSPKQAHQILINEYGNYVYTVVWDKLRNCASREDVEECVSDIFAEIFLHCNPDSEGSLKGYIGTVARRMAINRFYQISGKSYRTFSLEEKNILEIPADITPEQEYERTELRKILLEKIHQLGEPDASIIIQKYYYLRNSGEIAKSLSISPANVRMRLTRAVRKLKALLKEEDIDF